MRAISAQEGRGVKKGRKTACILYQWPLNMTSSLQKSIKVKDCVIKRLHEELVELRGPLPDDTNSEVTGETSVAGSVGKHDKPQWSKVACSSD